MGHTSSGKPHNLLFYPRVDLVGLNGSFEGHINSWFSWIGKTTTIIIMSRMIANRGKRVAIIVKEIGSSCGCKGGKRLRSYGQGYGWWVHLLRALMSLAYTLEELAKSFAPDTVLIEPSGVSIPSSIEGGMDLV